MYGEGVLYNFVFTEFPFKTVPGDVNAFHRFKEKLKLANSKLREKSQNLKFTKI